MTELKNIFVAVAGSTPQIITESLYDFIVQKNMTISRIEIITTLHGKLKCEDLLLKQNGQLYNFFAEFGIMAYTIPIEIITIKNADGRELTDIRDETDNSAAANFITANVARLCNEAGTRLLASLAGGRKTMSAYMAYAMQLYGRKNDKMFHVLIEPAQLEFNNGFFYPPKDKDKPLIYKDKEGRSIRIPFADIRITNAEIPFIRLRDHLSFTGDFTNINYQDLVQLTQREINEAFAPVIRITKNKPEIEVLWREKTWPVHFKPMDFVFYKYMLNKRQIVNSKSNPHLKKLEKLYLEFKPDSVSPDFSHGGLTDIRARINRLLKARIPAEPVLRYLLIGSEQKNRIPTYTLNLPDSSLIELL